MSLVRRNIFAPAPVAANDPMASNTGMEVSRIVGQARRDGGWAAGWRVSRVANAHNLTLVRHALDAFFVARREELTFRIALALDTAKKRAIAANLEMSGIIEREIASMAAAQDSELTRSTLDFARDAALEEVRRIRELNRALERGEITPHRFQCEQVRIESRTEAVAERAQCVADRMIESLGERLDAALRATQQPSV